MALHPRETTIGIDHLIDQAQRKLFNKLSAKWSVDIDAYPRCYVLERDEKRSVQHYESNGEYSGDLIHSEVNKFFFTAEDEQERINNELFTTKVQLYFILDLESIYPDLKDRTDAIVISDVISVLDMTPGFKRDCTIVTDYQEVFQGFDYDFDNIQPYYCFRIELKTNPYSIKQKC
jgi:hypothetical protein